MKKISALILTLVLLLSLAACGSGKPAETTGATTEATTEPTTEATTEATTEPTTEATTESTTVPTETIDVASLDYPYDAEQAAPIVGSWVYTMEMTGADMGLEDFGTALSLPMVFTFGEDGILTASISEEEAQASIDAFFDAFETYLVDTMYAQFADQGMDAEAADAAMQEQVGMTIAEYAATVLDSLSFTDLFGSIEISAKYNVDGELLYTYDGIDEEILAFQLEDDTLTLTESEDHPLENPDFIFPMVLTRAE